MKTGKTETGFDFEVAENIQDDFELIEHINASDEAISNLPKLGKYLLGDEQFSRLKEHVRQEGRVSLTRMQEEIIDILNKAAKN